MRTACLPRWPSLPAPPAANRDKRIRKDQIIDFHEGPFFPITPTKSSSTLACGWSLYHIMALSHGSPAHCGVSCFGWFRAWGCLPGYSMHGISRLCHLFASILLPCSHPFAISPLPLIRIFTATSLSPICLCKYVGIRKSLVVKRSPVGRTFSKNSCRKKVDGINSNYQTR